MEALAAGRPLKISTQVDDFHARNLPDNRS